MSKDAASTPSLTASIEGRNQHLSVGKFPPFELPAFTVLSGLNGAGKSHLLEAIKNGSVVFTRGGDEVPTEQIRLRTASQMRPSDSSTIDSTTLWRSREDWWNRIETTIFSDANIRALGNSLGEPFRHLADDDPSVFRIEEKSLSAEASKERAAAATNYRRQRLQILNAARTNLTRQGATSLKSVIEHVEAMTSKSIEHVTKEEFDEFAPLATGEYDPFEQGLTELFLAYARADLDNWIAGHAKAEGNAGYTPLSEQEFIERHGPVPWDYLNEILESGGYDFRVNAPSNRTVDQEFQARLHHLIQDVEIDFSDLSSGERVLISLVMLIYNVEDGRVRVNFPSVILFDEIDAPLHPSMIRSALETVQEFLVSQKGISVIWTTHSPSTVAMAPEDSLIRMNKQAPRLEKVNRTTALQSLTAGVPTLSVRPQDRRQVFTESYKDVEYLEVMREALKPRLDDSEFIIDFLPSSSSKSGSGCQVVVDMATALRESDLDTVFGLVDWDGGDNKSTADLPDFIFMLGEDQRHSIENYVLDPLLVAVYLLKDRSAPKALKEELLGGEQIGLAGGLDQPGVEAGLLGGVVSNVLEKIRPSTASALPTEVVTTVSNVKVPYPAWFLKYRGHDLFGLYTAGFPILAGRFNTEDELCQEILTEVVALIPGLLDHRILDMLNRLRSETLL